MKRSALVLLVAGLVMMMAVPSAAKKPPKPDDPPPPESTYYDVTISVVGDHGVSTTCSGPVAVKRDGIHFQTYNIDVPADEGDDIPYRKAELDIAAGELAWSGEAVTGCHGDADGFFDYFRITLEDDGTVAMLWIFDVVFTEVVAPVGRSGKTTIDTVREDFRMGGPYDGDGEFVIWTWDVGETQEGLEQISLTGLTGDFAFVHYRSGGHSDVEGTPLFVELDNWMTEFTLDITLTEVPPS